MGLLGLLFALFLGQTRGLDPLACGFGLWALRAALQVLGFGVLGFWAAFGPCVRLWGLLATRAAFAGGVAYP